MRVHATELGTEVGVRERSDLTVPTMEKRCTAILSKTSWGLTSNSRCLGEGTGRNLCTIEEGIRVL